jgi:triosephosphate isomerase (TIM)
MRKQIAAANWKMNLTLQEGEQLIDALMALSPTLNENQYALFAVPFPYLPMALAKLGGKKNILVAAQNCSDKVAGAYTGETSVAMLQSMQVAAVLIGHSERREYYQEDNALLAAKVNIALQHNVLPVFCCGEALPIREAGTQNDYVANQLKESLFHLSAQEITKLVIAYEPIWAIGTGKTATSEQVQEMHQHLRAVLAAHYGIEVANEISILYGGSVKAANAVEIFGKPDVDGGLVGGASLVATEFNTIINSLKA